MIPFGFGVSDFMLAAQLIDKIIQGLRTANRAVSQYQELDHELSEFQRALDQIQNLQVSDAHKPDLDMLKCVALGSGQVLEEFLAKLEKYNQSLGIGSTVSKVKSFKRKIQWAFPGMEAEVRDIRVIIAAHVGGLNMRQTTLGLSCMSTLTEDVKDIKERVMEVKDTGLAMKHQQTAQEQVLQETRRTLTNLFKLMKDTGELQPQIDRLIQLANNIWTETLRNPEVLVESNSSQSSFGLPSNWLAEPVDPEDDLRSPIREIASRPLRKISPLRKKRPPFSEVQGTLNAKFSMPDRGSKIQLMLGEEANDGDVAIG